jgi:hypothetical protein
MIPKQNIAMLLLLLLQVALAPWHMPHLHYYCKQRQHVLIVVFGTVFCLLEKHRTDLHRDALQCTVDAVQPLPGWWADGSATPQHHG